VSTPEHFPEPARSDLPGITWRRHVAAVKSRRAAVMAQAVQDACDRAAAQAAEQVGPHPQLLLPLD
jgi:hypothetical protein